SFQNYHVFLNLAISFFRSIHLICRHSLFLSDPTQTVFLDNFFRCILLQNPMYFTPQGGCCFRVKSTEEHALYMTGVRDSKKQREEIELFVMQARVHLGV